MGDLIACRRTWDYCKPRNVILVYGDLCLGMDNEIKKLAEEYGIVKIDAVNCINCQLGGKGEFIEADPNHDLLFLSSGMTDFSGHARDMMLKEGLDEVYLKQFFSGLRGIIVLDTLRNDDKLKLEIAKLDTGLEIVETWCLGCGKVKNVIKKPSEETRV